MNREEIATQLRAIFMSIREYNSDELRSDARVFMDLALESIDVLELAYHISEDLGVGNIDTAIVELTRDEKEAFTFDGLVGMVYAGMHPEAEVATATP